MVQELSVSRRIFRLDPCATHKQFAAPTVHGCNVLTTHTEHVNRYPSVLQITSYNFTGTPTTAELCAGVVKATPLHYKNPAQHEADFEMLKTRELLSGAFHASGGNENIICVQVDGASDEGPAHDEVQFWWAREHLISERLVTLLTARSSGSSFLNCVELQNGCLSRGHANLLSHLLWLEPVWNLILSIQIFSRGTWSWIYKFMLSMLVTVPVED